MSDYDHLNDDGAFVVTSGKEGFLMCCDCGLVHKMTATIADDAQRLITIQLTKREKDNGNRRGAKEKGISVSGEKPGSRSEANSKTVSSAPSLGGCGEKRNGSGAEEGGTDGGGGC